MTKTQRVASGPRHAVPLRLAAAALAIAFLCQSPASAVEQQTAKLPASYQSLGVNSDQPIQFDAEQLEVRQDEQTAIFTGHVIVQQGATVLKTDRLIVHYQGSPAGGEAQQVQRLDATGHVLVTSGNQTASGNTATFDTTANTIVLSGDVVLSQGENVIRGTRLTIDVKTNQAKMEGGRVQMLISPKSLKSNGG